MMRIFLRAAVAEGAFEHADAEGLQEHGELLGAVEVRVRRALLAGDAAEVDQVLDHLRPGHEHLVDVGAEDAERGSVHVRAEHVIGRHVAEPAQASPSGMRDTRPWRRRP